MVSSVLPKKERKQFDLRLKIPIRHFVINWPLTEPVCQKCMKLMPILLDNFGPVQIGLDYIVQIVLDRTNNDFSLLNFAKHSGRIQTRFGPIQGQGIWRLRVLSNKTFRWNNHSFHFFNIFHLVLKPFLSKIFSSRTLKFEFQFCYFQVWHTPYHFSKTQNPIEHQGQVQCTFFSLKYFLCLRWNYMLHTKFSNFCSLQVLTRHLMGSTDQADPCCFYFRISWILMERPWFYFFCPLHLLRGLRSTNIK